MSSTAATAGVLPLTAGGCRECAECSQRQVAFASSLEAQEEDDQEEVPACTYTSSLLPRPLDPTATCALHSVLSDPIGIHSVSFSGCGAFYPYMYGIACYLQDHYDLSRVHFLGTSGGCLPALTLATGLDVREAFYEKWNNHVIADSASRPMKALFSFIDVCHKHAHDYFGENIHELANGRLHLSTTRLQLKPKRGWGLWNTVRAVFGGVRLLQNQLTNQWESKSDIIDNVAASTYIPLFVDIRRGLVKSWRGEWHLDGGLTNNQPVLDSATVRLQPFMWTSASLLRKASFIWLRLSPEWHAEIFQQGYLHAQQNAQVFAHLPARVGPKETRPVVPHDIEQLIRKSKGEHASDDAASKAAAESAAPTAQLV